MEEIPSYAPPAPATPLGEGPADWTLLRQRAQAHLRPDGQPAKWGASDGRWRAFREVATPQVVLQLLDEHAALTTQLVTATETCGIFREANKSANAAIDRWENENEQLLLDLKNHRKENDTLQARAAALQQELDAKKERIACLLQELADQEQEKLELVKENQSQKSIIEALELVRAAHMAKAQQVIQVLMDFTSYEDARVLLETSATPPPPTTAGKGESDE